MSLFISMFRKKNMLCYTLVCIVMNSLNAQCISCGTNLVPNPDFEITTSQCDELDNQLFTDQTPVQDWYGTVSATSGSGTTPDYYNSICKGNVTENCGSGTGSVGVFTSTGSGDDVREYVQAKLMSPLKAGRRYCVTLKVKSAPYVQYIPTDGFGVWFNSLGMIDIDAMNGGKYFIGPGSIINATPQIQNTTGNIINSCQTISGSFCATGGEQWIVLGNFKKDNEMQPFSTCDCESGGACGTKCLNCVGGTCFSCPCKGEAYVMFDEISVQEACPTTLTVTAVADPAIIKCGDCTNITATTAGGDGKYTYTWIPNIGTGAGPHKVCPLKSTTYTVIANGNCGTLSDTTKVTVTVDCGLVVGVTSIKICEGSCNSLKATASGGTLPYTFSWSPATGLSTTAGDSVYACPQTTTSYTVTVTDKNGTGLSATATSLVTVHPKPPIKLSSAIICSGACDTIYASGAGAGGTYTWLSPLSGNAGSQRVCPATTTTYSVIGTDANGCKDTATNSVTVNALPQITAPDAGICPGGSTVLTATGANTYTWSPPTGLSGTTVASVTASPTVSTTYTVCGTTAGCTSCKNVNVTVGALIPRVTPDSSICIGSCMQLKAVGGTQYNWSPATGLNDPASASPIACPTITTTYTVTVSDGNCSGTAQVKITVTALPAIVASPAKICKGETTILKASGANQYIWSPAASLNPSTGSTVNATPAVTTTYTISGTSTAGCKGTTTVLVTVYPTPTVVAKGGSCCIGEQVQLKAQGALTYSWSPGTGLATTTDSVVTASPKQTITYTVTGIDVNGCKATDTALVTIFPEPHAAFITSPDKIDNFHPVVYFTDQSYSLINFWKWNFGDAANSISFLKDPVFTYPNEIGDYPVKLLVTNQYGCTDSTTKNVHIGGIFTFYVPNVFTPGNDAINESFTPKGVGIDETDYELWIFNRWGDLIWKTHTWGEAWDGKANGGGSLAQIDTYVWKAKVREKETHKIHIYIGHVSIVK